MNSIHEDVPNHLPNKKAAPLHSRLDGRASGSSSNFKRAVNRILEHKGQQKTQECMRHPKGLGLPCLPVESCAVAMAESALGQC